MGKSVIALVVVVACAAAGAAEKDAGRGGNAATPAFAMNPKTDAVLCRLGLTEDQAKVINRINAEADGKKAEYRGARIKELQEEVKKKVREVLTADQQSRFDEGLKIVAECEARIKAAKSEMAAAIKADKSKATEARKACEGKVAAAGTERDKSLDDRVGKAPTAN